MKHLLDIVLQRRAGLLARRLAPHLPPRGYALDVGAGTGHNSRMLRRYSPLAFVDLDVVNMRVVAGDAVLFDGCRMPFASDTFDCALLVFVLHYVAGPLVLLEEIRRVTHGPVLLLQTTYSGRVGALAARGYDYLWGPVAFAVARASGLITARQHALDGTMFYTRPHLLALLAQAGFHAHLIDSTPWPAVPVRYDLFFLTRWKDTLP